MKKHLFIIIFTIGLLFTSTTLKAQPGFDDDVEDTPLDGGIALLIGAGVAVGYKKLTSKINTKL